MKQIQKKDCMEDTESIVMPSISFTTFSELSNHSTAIVNEIQLNLNRLDFKASFVRNSSKGLFRPSETSRLLSQLNKNHLMLSPGSKGVHESTGILSQI